MSAKIHGLEKVIRTLNSEAEKMKRRTFAGLIKSAIIIRRDMEKVSPKIPVDTGNLRQSWFTDPQYLARKPSIKFGFTANYAFAVHENMDPKINWKRPGAGPKFLEAALKRNEKVILDTLRNEAEF